MKGLVTKTTGSWYTVLPADGTSPIKARLRGSMRMVDYTSTAPVVVGDGVDLTQNATGEWVITAVAPRANYLVRRSTNLSHERHIIAANLDHIYIVVSLATPSTPLEFIDRVLVGAECYRIPVSILVNKADVAAPNAYFTDIYHKAGYMITPISALTGMGIAALRDQIAGRKVLFTGNSGVGKSSIINALDPTLSARTGEVSLSHGKGKHTTTFSEIFPLADGYLIDTPGIKGFGLVGVAHDELYHYFPEILSCAVGCAFSNCTHTHEPACAVRAAAGAGVIALERYESYLKMLSEDQKYR
ncbi:MAG: ribosome small subunit-dependent GTPase A [Mucinivorans sp.]